jgi:cytoskeletal protein CcmA (bactofilin family)
VIVATSEASTVIGESIAIHGNVSGDEDLTVRGRIEGTVTVTKALVVEAGAVVKAEIQARSCTVSGAVVGNVTAADSVEITKDGRMVGDITARRVILADGASFRGRIEMGEVDVEEAGRAASRPVERPLRAVASPAGEKAAPRAPAPPVPVAVAAVKRKVVVRRK